MIVENGTRRLSAAMSKKMSHLMFIMSVLVVYIHFADFSYAALPGYGWESLIERAFFACFGRVAVPLFFCLSGYLTFSKIQVNSKSLVLAYKTKVKTLLVPYLLWNIFYTLVFVCTKLMNHTLHEVDNWGILLLESVFLHGQNGALWYILSLMVLTLAAPALFVVYKNKPLSVAFALIACIAFFFVEDTPAWLPLTGLAYYSIGATAAMHFQKNVDGSFWSAKTKKIVSVISLVVFVSLCVLRLTAFDKGQSDHEIRRMPLCRMIEAGLAFSFWFAADLVDFGKIKVRSFEQNSFLIYVAHNFGIVVVHLLLDLVPLDMTPVTRLAVYLLGPIVIVAAISTVSGILKKVMPRFHALISGGR